jgi:xylulose-5-phosphate/fructose-6-phosphate phosphoketolase
MHVRGYKEKGDINTPLELAIFDRTDRCDRVIDAIDRVPGLAVRAAHLMAEMKNAIIDQLSYARTHATGRPEINDWVWPY